MTPKLAYRVPCPKCGEPIGSACEDMRARGDWDHHHTPGSMLPRLARAHKERIELAKHDNH